MKNNEIFLKKAQETEQFIEVAIRDLEHNVEVSSRSFYPDTEAIDKIVEEKE